MPTTATCRVCFQCGSTGVDQQSCASYFLHRCNRCGREEEGQRGGEIKTKAGVGVLRCEPLAVTNFPVHVIALHDGSSSDAQVEELIRRLQLDARIARIVRTICVGGRWIEHVVFSRVPPSPPPPAQQRQQSASYLQVVACAGAHASEMPVKVRIAA